MTAPAAAPVPPPVVVPTSGPASRDRAADPVVLDLTGMTCSACAVRIEKVLSRVPGVEQATVNLALETAEVRAPGIEGAALVAAVERAGYGATLRAEAARARRQALETAAAERRAEERRTLLVFALSAVLTLPFVVAMVPMAWGAHAHWLTPTLQLALATPVQIVAGWRFYVGAFKALRGVSANMDVLVALGTTAAFLFSVAMIASHGEHAVGHLYFEGSATILTLILAGKLMEARARRAASAAVASLMALRPDTAIRLVGEVQETVSIDDLRSGDRILVKPGERVAADGLVEEGASELDESLVTGESLPVAKGPGDKVTAGTINGSGALTVTVRAVGEDTVLARIARLVEQAQIAKAPVQKLVDRVAALFVPVIVVVALATFAGWLLVGAETETAFVAAVSVLVIACPCALGLATPAALVAGTGAAAKAGILIKDIEALERAHAVDVVVFDKTGTLTAGHPAVTDVVVFGGRGDDMLRLAASVQAASEHPLAKAMVAAAFFKGLVLSLAREARAVTGRGVTAIVDGRRVAIGNAALMAELSVDTRLYAKELARLEAEAKTVVTVARDGEAVGLIAMADPIRPDSRAAVAALQARGIACRMLTGDAAPVAAAVGTALGLDGVEGPVPPERKAAAIAAMRRDGRIVAMVGDGINDAPALAAADVGIAIGTGADVALETAGITLMRPDPRLVPAALEIARATWAKIRQNLFWAFAYNVVGVPLAALGYLTPALAGAAMALSSVSVVTNALTLTRWKPTLADGDGASGPRRAAD
ncbi:heavy metal translocating P-type ATPase [Prosthecomicrobium hirschii]|uniref:heavy metal translocating P-type ATPase n=1 Tax=Prosthecodimorpha hirschii TaxID=665126 RepID=UPI002220CEF0|nr:heavy metal translocating P-type ATPase [Prosthecomicrobium hirschii]MCW1843305.1 heavy metal translocating P-type ATPase [Prosthecomicrobium hirschii]